MAFWVLDDNNNKVEAFDKEGVLAVLEQAIKEGTLEKIMEDSAFVSKIKCCVSGVSNKIAFVSQTKYNELKAEGLLQPNAWYFITDDTTAEDLDGKLEEVLSEVAGYDKKFMAVNDKFNSHFESSGVCHKARITNFTNIDVEVGSASGSGQFSFDEQVEDEVFFNKPCYLTWVDDNNNTYSLGIIEPPKTPSGTGGDNSTYSYSCLTPLVVNESEKPYYLRAVVKRTKYMKNTIPYYTYYVKVQSFTTQGYGTQGLVIVDDLDFAGGTLYIRPIL